MNIDFARLINDQNLSLQFKHVALPKNNLAVNLFLRPSTVSGTPVFLINIDNLLPSSYSQSAL